MATSIDYIQYVCEQLHVDYAVRYKKMFGEYMVYVDDKPILLVCDNMVFVKKLDALASLMQNADYSFPYEGAKEHYVLDIDDNAIVNDVVEMLVKITPLPKKKPSNKRLLFLQFFVLSTQTINSVKLRVQRRRQLQSISKAQR